MKKLRIAYVTPRYFPFVGGVEYVVRNLAERLALQGHEVTVIAGDPHGRRTITETMNHVHVIRVPTYTLGDAYHIPKEKNVVKRLLEESFDVVHTNSVHAIFSLLPLEIKVEKLKFDWKLVMSMHHSTEGYTFLRRILWKLIWRRRVTNLLGNVGAVHATSPVEADTISEHFPSVKDRLVTIPIGIEEDVFNHRWKGRNSDYLLYCGRLEKYKRVDVAVRAVMHLAELGHSIRLLIVGNGSEAKKAKSASKEFGEYITYLPHKSRNEYLELISNARAVISLSSAENFNVFLAEACAIGVPLIATREAAAFCPELANIKALSPAHVAEEILRLTSDTQVDHSGHVLKTWDEVIRQFEALYNTLT